MIKILTIVGVLFVFTSCNVMADYTPYTDFSYTTNAGSIYITRYNGTNAVVSVPPTINGLPVDCVGSNSFRTNMVITMVTISSNVTSIGNYAFYYCGNVTNITILGTSISYGAGAFLGCYKLTTVLTPNVVGPGGNVPAPTAAAVVQSNLTVHINDPNNPHNIITRIAGATNPIPSWITASTSGLVRATITNGLASTNYVINYVAEAISGIPVYATGNNIYVDNQRTDPFTPDGTIMRPYATVSAAMAVIGSSQPADWENENLRYYAVKVMPGTYLEDVSVPWRPFISIDLSSAVIVGNVTRSIPDGDFSTRVSTLVIKGDSLRPAYLDGAHTVIGIAGKVIFEAAQSSVGMCPFHELQVIDAGISGGVEYKGTQNANSGQSGHIFLRDSQVGTIQSTEGWSGVSLFSYGWGGGHQGGGPAGSGIGSLIGRVLPYNLQSTMISGGMNLQDCFPGTSPEMLWHNVRFETNFIYNVTNVSYGVKLDTASYNSWLEASLPEERGVWTTDGKMVLTDGLTSTGISAAGGTTNGQFIVGSGRLYMTDIDGTSTLYHITSCLITNLIGSFTGGM